MTEAQLLALVAVMVVILHYVWITIVLGTCIYLVFWQGHSGWWYLLALTLCGGWSSRDEKRP